jgi:hypothetical protein
MINSVLQHRATVERSTETLIEGSPVRTWAVTMVRAPVLLSRDEAVTDPTWTASQAREAGARCTLFASASIDIRPGDRVHVTRPPMAGSFEVLPDPSTVMTLHSISHREYKVRSVS